MAMAERVKHPDDYLPTLDGWRAIAALTVIASHTPWAWACGRKDLGGHAVSVFFGLSGLLICSRLLAEHGKTGRVDLTGFYVRRVFRILPPALAYLAVLAVLGAAGAVAVSPRELWACLLFYRNYTTGGHWITIHFWSLAVEEHFYLFIPALLAWLGPRRALPVAIGLALPLAVWHKLDDEWVNVAARTGLPTAYHRTDTRLPDLLFGCAVALMAGRAPGRVARVAGTAGGILLAARVFGQLPVPHLLLSILIPWMLLATARRPTGLVGRVLEWGPLRWLGRMSYGLYLWQQLFFHGSAVNPLPALGPLPHWPWNLLATLTCAAASHYLLERPLTRFGRRLADRRRAADMVAEPAVMSFRLTPGRQRSVTRPDPSPLHPSRVEG
jgi:peptidoglycan/LPS O-acetylase OafA/YrhL